jgi:hypothetical protein
VRAVRADARRPTSRPCALLKAEEEDFHSILTLARQLAEQDLPQPAIEALVYDAMRRTVRFLDSQHVRPSTPLPWRRSVLPLAALVTVLGPELESSDVADRLRQWFWTTLFTDKPRPQSVAGPELRASLEWIRNGNARPATALDAACHPEELLRTRAWSRIGSAALLVQLAAGARDLVTGEPFHDQPDSRPPAVHWIFPVAWCRKHDVEPAIALSAINRIPLTGARLMVVTDGLLPSQIFSLLADALHDHRADVDWCLRSHGLDGDALLRDDHLTVLHQRADWVAALIRDATGLDTPTGDAARPSSQLPLTHEPDRSE